MSNANRDYAIVYDVKNSSLVLSRPLIFYITDKNTSNIFVRLVTKVNIGNGVDQYTDIEKASNYVLTMRVIKPNNEVKSIEATQHEPESIFQFDLTEDFKDIPGKYICELTISTIVSSRQELITSDPFSYEVKRSILSNVGEIIETEDTTVEKLLNDLDATKAELSSQIKDIENKKATKQEVEIERQRINSFTTLENGSTTGDAELIDARIGIDGVTYSNLGNAVRGQVNKLKEDINNLKYFNYDMSGGEKGWIRHGTGQFAYSDATKCWVFNKNNLTHFKAFLKSDTDVIDGISFFSGTEISESTYLDSSIAWKGNYQNGAWYDVTIPEDANLICVTSGIQNGFVPKILFLTDEVLGVTDNKYKNSIELNANKIVELQKSINSKNDTVLYGLDRYIYHFGMNEVATRTETPPVVPSQSIYDVQYAKKLGYKCIEVNLHKTQDGKYVVTHGMNGCLGHDFDDLEGNDAYGVVIAETTFETLRNNYRYRSSNENYRVPITSLEEFCAEVKKEGLVLMLQYNDITSLNIARGILGDNNLFMYNAPRQDYDGPILEYLYYNTKEEILNRCRLVGRPYIYSMDNPSKFDDDILQDIVNSLHEEGFYIASAYVGDGKKYLKMGFDFISISGTSKELGDNEIVIDNKVLTFNLGGSVSWRDL